MGKRELTVDKSDEVVFFAVRDERFFFENIIDELVNVSAGKVR